MKATTANILTEKPEGTFQGSAESRGRGEWRTFMGSSYGRLTLSLACGCESARCTVFAGAGATTGRSVGSKSVTRSDSV